MSDKEYIVLADGSKIDPDTGKLISNKTAVSIPNATQAQKLVLQTQRKIVDLPDVPRTMNTIGVVLCYHLFGLDDYEISIATGLPQTQVAAIRSKPQYEDMMHSIVEQVMAAQSEDIRHLFTQYSRSAVETVADIMVNGEDEFARLGASKDLLDRAGHRPADLIIEKRTKSETDLRITYISKSEQAAPDEVIDITPIREGESDEVQQPDQ